MIGHEGVVQVRVQILQASNCNSISGAIHKQLQKWQHNFTLESLIVRHLTEHFHKLGEVHVRHNILHCMFKSGLLNQVGHTSFEFLVTVRLDIFKIHLFVHKKHKNQFYLTVKRRGQSAILINFCSKLYKISNSTMKQPYS